MVGLRWDGHSYGIEAKLRVRKWRPRGDSNPSVQYVAYSVEALSLQSQQVIVSRHKLPLQSWPKLAEQHRTQGLRQLAQKYGVSHESIRRALASAKGVLT